MPEKSVLFVFPHGIGDFIMATPAFREFRKRSPRIKIGIAVHSGPWSSGQVHRCPHFDEVYLIHNPWFSRDYLEGQAIVMRQVADIQKFSEYEEVTYIWLRQPAKQIHEHKVEQIAASLNVTLSDDSYDVYLDEDAEQEAEEWLRELGFQSGKFAFIHTHSTDIRKNSAAKMIRNLARQKYSSHVFEVGKTFAIRHSDIAVSFAVMKRAGYVGLVDSVFVHAADALGVTIDAHVTTPLIESANRPLHAQRLDVVNFRSGPWIDLVHRLAQKIGPARFTIARVVSRLLGRSARPRMQVDEAYLCQILEAAGGRDDNRLLIKDWCLMSDRQNLLWLPVLLELEQRGGQWTAGPVVPLAPVGEALLGMKRSGSHRSELLVEFAAGNRAVRGAGPGVTDVFYERGDSGPLIAVDADAERSVIRQAGVYSNSDDAKKDLSSAVEKLLRQIQS